MGEDYQEHGTWEFLAVQKPSSQSQGTNHFIVADFEIGDAYFRDAIVATAYPLFAQILWDDFKRLVQAGYIRDVETAEKFVADFSENVKNGVEGYQNICDLVLGKPPANSEDEPWKESLDDPDAWKQDQTIPVLHSYIRPIQSKERLLKPYGFAHIGKADITIIGRYNPHTFRDVWITSGSKKLLGLGLVVLLADYRIGDFPDLGGVVVHGFLNY